jgi:uncharacterized protein (DUF2267 family)
VDLVAQLAMLIRGMYYEGWSTNGKPARQRRKEKFLGHIAEALRDIPETYSESVAWGVFEVLDRRVSAGEIGDVRAILPAEIRALWPDGECSHGS